MVTCSFSEFLARLRAVFPTFARCRTRCGWPRGIGSLVSALVNGLPKANIWLGTRVTHVTLDGDEVEVGFVDAVGATRSMKASHILFALPPRLLEATVTFSLALDAATARNWRDTPTWIAPHGQFFALYDRPFWREAGLSGTAQSAVGPLIEIHDATTASRVTQSFHSGKWQIIVALRPDPSSRQDVSTEVLSPIPIPRWCHLYSDAGIQWRSHDTGSQKFTCLLGESL